MKNIKTSNAAAIQTRRAETSAPPGLIFSPEFLTGSEEADLLAFIRTIEFRTFRMHGVTAKRRIKQYGWHYAFELDRRGKHTPSNYRRGRSIC